MKNKGFTLIELLAVITIMGILMMVAIPAVSRTIENSRRDTFADIAHEYINAVRNSMLADNIECFQDNKWTVASATATGYYFFPICTDAGSCDEVSAELDKDAIVQSTSDLMETGGRSPFGNAELKGYVLLEKSVTTDADGGELKTKSVYSIVLGDTGKHGLSAPKRESEVKRSNISMSLTEVTTNAPDKITVTNADGTPQDITDLHPCKIS